MATKVNPVTQQIAWTYATEGANVYFDQTGALSDPQTYTYAATNWLSQLGASPQRIVVTPSVECNNLALKFVGSPAYSVLTAPTNRYRGLVGIWGVSQVSDGSNPEFLGEVLGSAMVEVGIVGASGSSIMPDGNGTPPEAYFCRIIEPKIDRSLFPGFRIVGNEQEACPILLLDAMGYKHFIIEMRLSAEGQTAASELGFLYREI